MSNSEREVRQADGRVEHPDSPYERKDVYFGRILALLIATGCVFVMMFALDWYFFRAERRTQDERKRSPYARSSAGPPALPSQPRLEQIDRMEGNPEGSYEAKAAEMLRLLHTTGPAGEEGFVHVSAGEQGFIHIPIEQAMNEIVKKLPARKEPSREALHPVYSGSSNSGRMLQGAPPWSEQ